MPSKHVPSERAAVIAIDPHKASWTAAAVDAALALLATLRVPVSRQGYRELLGFASRWPRAGELATRVRMCCLPGTAARTTTPTRSRSASPR